MPIIRSSRLLALLPHMVCNALVAGGRVFGVCDSHNFPHPGHIACRCAPNSGPPATKTLHTICGNKTSIVSRSWWWTYECPKHVEQIINAIKRSVAYSWFDAVRFRKLVWSYRHRMTGNFCVVLREEHPSKIAGCDTMLLGRCILAYCRNVGTWL